MTTNHKSLFLEIVIQKSNFILQMDPPPSFKAEVYYLVAKFLENGPCQNAAAALRNELESNELVPPRYDWKGSSHQKTFR